MWMQTDGGSGSRARFQKRDQDSKRPHHWSGQGKETLPVSMLKPEANLSSCPVIFAVHTSLSELYLCLIQEHLTYKLNWHKYPSWIWSSTSRYFTGNRSTPRRMEIGTRQIKKFYERFFPNSSSIPASFSPPILRCKKDREMKFLHFEIGSPFFSSRKDFDVQQQPGTSRNCDFCWLDVYSSSGTEITLQKQSQNTKLHEKYLQLQSI